MQCGDHVDVGLCEVVGQILGRHARHGGQPRLSASWGRSRSDRFSSAMPGNVVIFYMVFYRRSVFLFWGTWLMIGLKNECCLLLWWKLMIGVFMFLLVWLSVLLVLVVAVLLVLGIVVTVVVEWFRVFAVLLFLELGMLLVGDGLGWIYFGDVGLV